MKKAYILSDKENIRSKIVGVMSKMTDKVQVVGVTSNTHEAIIEVIKHKPDFIILALNEARERIKFFDKYKVIRICREDEEPVGNICRMVSEKEIDSIIKEIDSERNSKTEVDTNRLKQKSDIVVVGISTGGPYALKEMIPKIKNRLTVPMIIVQHMPPGFTKEMAKGLKRISELDIIEADERMEVSSGMCYVIPGGRNMGIKKEGQKLIFYEYKQKYGFYTPSIDYLLETITACKTLNPLVAIMTGMGNDGFEGIRKLRHEKKGLVMTQSKESCVVYGMPRVIDDAGMSDIPGLTIDKIAEEINKRV